MFFEDVAVTSGLTAEKLVVAYGHSAREARSIWALPENRILAARGDLTTLEPGDTFNVPIPWKLTVKVFRIESRGVSFELARDGGRGTRLSWVQTSEPRNPSLQPSRRPRRSAASCIPLLLAGCQSQQAPKPSVAPTSVVAKPQPAVEHEAPMTETSPDPLDPERANEAVVVLRVRALERPASDKYAWAKVRVLRVLKNTSGHSLPDELEIAYYAWDSGVPQGESTVYLEPYNSTPDHPWKLLGGSSKRGVSHTAKQGP